MNPNKFPDHILKIIHTHIVHSKSLYFPEVCIFLTLLRLRLVSKNFKNYISDLKWNTNGGFIDYEYTDPNLVSESDKKHTIASIRKSVTDKNTNIDILKDICRLLGLTRSHAKPELQQKILEFLPPTDTLYDLEFILHLHYLKSRLVTHSSAISDYKLKPIELDAIPCEERRNPHYAVGPPMKLYLLRDVIELLHKKFPEYDDFKLNLDKSEQRKQKVLETKKRKMVVLKMNQSIRRNLLQRDLSAKGLELRTDSRLCVEYIQLGNIARDLVVNIMDEMRFFYNHTNYNAIMSDLMSDRENRMDFAGTSHDAKGVAFKQWRKTKTHETIMAIVPQYTINRFYHSK
jgi:hypothetical protein